MLTTVSQLNIYIYIQQTNRPLIPAGPLGLLSLMNNAALVVVVVVVAAAGSSSSSSSIVVVVVNNHDNAA